MAALVLAVCLAGCASPPVPQAAAPEVSPGTAFVASAGFDREASRAAARAYRAQAARRRYQIPGPPGDPWGPHIREAAARFQVPERWVREIMRQETGGRLHDARGLPITSPVGAMGLMQVIPQTYDLLQARHGLGADPYEPRDNILAGAAYIREMYERFGAPGFAAAYNAGPERMANYLSGAQILPDETVNYVANVAPRLGQDLPMGGPMMGDAGTGVLPIAARTGDAATFVIPRSEDASLRAYEGGGLVSTGATTGAVQ